MNWEEEEDEKDNNLSNEEDEKKDSQSDSESGEAKPKVRTPKQKLKDLIKENYHSIKNAIPQKDFSIIYEKFENTIKNLDKILSLFPKDELPIFF